MHLHKHICMITERYIHIYIYIYTYIYIYIHIYIYIYIHTYIFNVHCRSVSKCQSRVPLFFVRSPSHSFPLSFTISPALYLYVHTRLITYLYSHTYIDIAYIVICRNEEMTLPMQ